TPMKRRSPGMITAGIVLLSLGGAGVIAGSALVAAGSQTHIDIPPCVPEGPCEPIVMSDSGLKVGGITMIVVSTLALGAGIPLLVIGLKKVPDRALAPTVRVGAGGASMRWQF